MVIVWSYYKAKIYIWNIRGDSNTFYPAHGGVLPIKLLTYRSHLLASQTDKWESVGFPTWRCVLQRHRVSCFATQHGFFRKRWCVFGGVFLRPRTTYLFSRGRTCVHRLPYRAMKDCYLFHGVASLSVGEDFGSLQTPIVLAQNFCLLLTALPAVGIRPVILQGASLQAPNGAVVQKLCKNCFLLLFHALSEERSAHEMLDFFIQSLKLVSP